MKKVIVFIVLQLAICRVYADETTSLVGGVVPGLPTFSLGMPQSEPEKWGVTGDELYWDAFSVFDGVSSTKMDDYAYYGVGSARGTIGFDAGTPRHITGILVKQTSSFGDRNQYIKLQGSNDGETWVTVVENTGTIVSASEFTTLAAKEDVASYRYFKIVDSTVNDLLDVEIISDDILIKANAPQVWADESLAATDSEQGVLVSGTLVYAPAATKVTAYVATYDYGDNLSRWVSNGTALELGTLSAGETFSGRFTGLKAGRYYWRVFGVAEEKSGASQLTRPFIVGSTDSAAPLYMNLKGSGDADLYRIYDGALDKFGNIATNIVWFTFDCSGIDTRSMSAALKFWSVSEYRRTWNSLRGIKVDVSYDNPVAATSWNPEEQSDWAGRWKYMGATEPEGLTWQTIATGEIFTDPQSTIEELVLPKFSKNPTYIRIRDLYKGQAREVQLRLCKRPSGFMFMVR